MGVLNYTQSGRALAIEPNDEENIPSVSGGENTQGCILYVGFGGDVSVTTIGGDNVTFKGVPTGTTLQVRIIRLLNTETTAKEFLALW